MTMRVLFVATVCVVYMASVAMAQNKDGIVPREIGNCANGFCYQPTPSKVIGTVY
jgi:hypothetical protein